jgi:hypothetical protein
MTFERIIDLTPAWDKRHADARKDYGVHGVDLYMVVKGPKGAVQFLVYTNWMLPHVQKERDQRTATRGADETELRCFYHPLPADVSYHSPAPMYEGQEPMSGECEYTGGECYYDGSSLRAEKWYNEILLPKGSDGIWAALEQEYRERFGAEEP